MGGLDVETSKNVCNSFEKTFGVGEENKATMVDIIYFLLSTQLAAIVNEVSRVVISGKGFRYSLSFPWYFLLGGRNVPRAIRESVSDRVFMLEMVVWFETNVMVGVGSFPVDRHGDRAIFLSGCFGVKKGKGTHRWIPLTSQFHQPSHQIYNRDRIRRFHCLSWHQNNQTRRWLDHRVCLQESYQHWPLPWFHITPPSPA